jgi:hypothetical protein
MWGTFLPFPPTCRRKFGSEVEIFGTLEVCTVDCYQVAIASTLLVNISVLRIRDVYPGSRVRLFSIPDPGSEFFECCGSGMFILDPGSEFFPSRIRIFPSQIRDPHQRIVTQKKWFLSSRKYDPGCSSWIPDKILTFYPSWIPGSKRQRIPGSKKAPDPGSATLEYLKELSLVRFMYTFTVNTVNSQTPCTIEHTYISDEKL